MSEQTVIFGFGPAGRAVTELLVSQGRRVSVAQRGQPANPVAGVGFRPCDVLDGEAVRLAVADASQVVLAVGFPYIGKVWREAWPRAMTNVVEACAASDARLTFVDNLYMYGPQDMPLREDMSMKPHGVKPAARVETTNIWMAASQGGRVRAASLRAPDFYGPGVTQSHLGALALGALARGKPAFAFGPPDMPHDFAYIPDIARAVVALLDAPDDAFGQVWHMPCAPTRTRREIFELAATALNVRMKISAPPFALLKLLGLGMPSIRELLEMRFQWDRPYHVDARKFVQRFGFETTSFEIGVPAAALSWVGNTG